MSFEYIFRYIIIGEIGVGKSSVLVRFTSDKFKAGYGATVGVEFLSQICEIGGKQIKLQIWDTAGQEQYRSIARSYYRSVAGIFLVYDITRWRNSWIEALLANFSSRQSFEAVERWLHEAKSEANEKVTFLLIGNKSDLLEAREVSYDEGARLAHKHSMDFVEVSAKDDVNIREAFSKASMEIVDKIKHGELKVDEIVSLKKRTSPSSPANFFHFWPIFHFSK